MAKLEDERVVQRRLMKRMNLLIEANFAYSGHVIIENPLHSKFWRQDFFTDILDKLPPGRRWRKFTVNYCRVGGRHFKAIQFYTTLPPAATAHMGAARPRAAPSVRNFSKRKFGYSNQTNPGAG